MVKVPWFTTAPNLVAVLSTPVKSMPLIATSAPLAMVKIWVSAPLASKITSNPSAGSALIFTF